MRRRRLDPFDRRSMVLSAAFHGTLFVGGWASTLYEPPVMAFETYEIELVSPPPAVQSEEVTPATEEIVVERPEPEPAPPEPEVEEVVPVDEPDPDPPPPEPEEEPRGDDAGGGGRGCGGDRPDGSPGRGTRGLGRGPERPDRGAPQGLSAVLREHHPADPALLPVAPGRELGDHGLLLHQSRRLRAGHPVRHAVGEHRLRLRVDGRGGVRRAGEIRSAARRSSVRPLPRPFPASGR